MSSEVTLPCFAKVRVSSAWAGGAQLCLQFASSASPLPKAPLLLLTQPTFFPWEHGNFVGRERWRNSRVGEAVTMKNIMRKI